jgi:hypothetical protein
MGVSLYREAQGVNNDLVSFLFFYQVLQTTDSNPVEYVDRTSGEIEDPDFERLIGMLPLNGKSLGEYLYEDCRHAIAHIKRDPSKDRLEINLDSAADAKRISVSVDIVKEFARKYIREELALHKYLYLANCPDVDLPVFMEESEMAEKGCF